MARNFLKEDEIRRRREEEKKWREQQKQQSTQSNATVKNVFERREQQPSQSNYPRLTANRDEPLGMDTRSMATKEAAYQQEQLNKSPVFTRNNKSNSGFINPFERPITLESKIKKASNEYNSPQSAAVRAGRNADTVDDAKYVYENEWKNLQPSQFSDNPAFKEKAAYEKLLKQRNSLVDAYKRRNPEEVQRQEQLEKQRREQPLSQDEFNEAVKAEPLSETSRRYALTKDSRKGNAEKYKEMRDFYGYKLVDNMQSDSFKQYIAKNANNKGILDVPANSFYGFENELTPTEKAYYNYLGTMGENVQNDFKEYWLDELKTRRAKKADTDGAGKQLGRNYALGLANAIEGNDQTAKNIYGAFRKLTGKAPIEEGRGGWVDNEYGAPYAAIKSEIDQKSSGGLQRVANLSSRAIGQMTPALAAGMANGGLASAATFSSTYGNTYKQGVKEGLTPEQANLKGALSAASEVGTQRLLGGIKGLSNGSGVFTKLAQSKFGESIMQGAKQAISNPTVRAVGRNAVKGITAMTDEGFEEYLQDAVIAPVIDGIVEGKAPQINLKDPNAIESFIVGAVTAGAMNAPSSIRSTVSDVASARYSQNVARAQQAIQDIAPQENAPQSDMVNAFDRNAVTAQNNANIEQTYTRAEREQIAKDIYYELQRNPELNKQVPATMSNATKIAKNPEMYQSLFGREMPAPQRTTSDVPNVFERPIESNTVQQSNSNIVQPNDNIAPQNNNADTDYMERIKNSGQYEIVSSDAPADTDAMTAGQKAVYYGTDAQGAIMEIAKANKSGKMYQMIDSAKNAKIMAENQITRKLTDIYGNTVGEGLATILKPVMGDANKYTELQAVMYSQHAEAREQAGKPLLREGAKLSNAELEQALSDPVIKNTVDALHNYIYNVQQIMVDYGLVSNETMQAWRDADPYYIPSHRDLEGNNGTGFKSNGSVSIDSGVRRAKGSTEKIIPLHEELQNWIETVTKQGTLNRFMNELAGVYFNGGDTKGYIKDVYKYDGSEIPKNSVMFKIDGENYVMEMNEYLYKGIEDVANGMGVAKIPFLNKMSKGFKGFTTGYNAVFGLAKNPLKDQQTAIKNSEYKIGYMKNVATMLPRYLKGKISKNSTFAKQWDLYMARGNTDNGMFEYNPKTKSFDKSTRKGIQKFRAPLDGIERIAWIFEQIPRFSEFCATLDAEGITKKLRNGEKLTAADEAGINRASYNSAKVTTNFKRGGKLIRTIDANGAPYSNAGIQGSLQIKRNFTETDINGKSKGATLGNAIATALLYVVPAGLGADAVLRQVMTAITGDEEWFDTLSDHEKNSYYHFGKDFKIPKSEMDMALGNAARLIELSASGASKKEIVEGFTDMVSSMVPNPASSNLLMPAIRTSLNKTYWGDDIETSEEIRSKDAWARYDENTSEFAKAFSKAIASYVDIGPKKVDEIIDSYFGYAGDLLISATTKKNWDNGVASGLKNTFINPFERVVKSDPLRDNTKVFADYYDMQDKLEKVNNPNSNATDKFTLNFFKNRDSELKDLRKQYKQAQDSGDRDKMFQIKGEREKVMKYNMDNAEKYRQITENVLSKYPNFDYNDENQRKIVKMQIDKEFGGAEYALKEYGKSAHDKAVAAKKDANISFDDSYKYYAYKANLPKNMKDSEKNAKVLDYLSSEVRNGSIDKSRANAVASYYVKDIQTIVNSHNYDVSTPETIALSKMSDTQRSRYAMTAQVFQGVTPEQYQKTLSVYNKGGTKNEKIAYLMNAGMSQASAEMFHKIHSNSKGFKTQSSATSIRKDIPLTTSAVDEIVSGYERITDSDSAMLAKKRDAYIKSMVCRMPKQLRQQYTDQKLYSILKNHLSNVAYY